MAKPLSSRTLLTLLLAAPLLGCVAKPPEKPIVLRPPHPERRLVRRLPRRSPGQAPTTSASAATGENVNNEELPPPEQRPTEQRPAEQPVRDQTLDPAEKESLLRDFERYLARPRHAP